MKILLTIGTLYCLLPTALAQSEIPPPWSDIQLTGYEAKVAIAEPPPGKGIPLWVPIIGGVITGGGIYWLLREEDTDPTCEFTVDIATQTAHCGNANGSAEVRVTPEGNYGITWPDGIVGERREDLAPGSYTVTITPSGSDCPQMVEFSIEDATIDFTAVAEGSPTQCGQADGAATATVTGSGEYSYAWSDGRTGPEIGGLASGTYTVEVTQAATGCTVAASVVIKTIPLALELLEEATPSGPTATDGAVSLAVTGPGSPPYQLVHNGTVLLTFEGAVVTVTGLGWGSHEFQVRSVEGCPSNPVSVSFAQLGSGWTIGAALGGPGGGSTPGSATVEHPVPEAAGPGPLRSGLRLIHRGQYSRTVWQCWPGTAGEIVVSFSPQWRGRWGRLAGATGPGIWWPVGSGTAFGSVDWRWAAALEVGLPQYSAGGIGIEVSYGPVGRHLGLVVNW